LPGTYRSTLLGGGPLTSEWRIGENERDRAPGASVIRSANERGATAESNGFRRPAEGPEGMEIKRIG
jgi:hypothetical protein